jgi:hypothetical protein
MAKYLRPTVRKPRSVRSKSKNKVIIMDFIT